MVRQKTILKKSRKYRSYTRVRNNTNVVGRYKSTEGLKNKLGIIIEFKFGKE